jgi:hypothetical protein
MNERGRERKKEKERWEVERKEGREKESGRGGKRRAREVIY